jgi:hypothetical protein
MAGRWQAYRAWHRRNIARTWPIVTGSFAAMLAGAALEDENGAKSVTAWVISAAIGVAVYAVAEWVRRHPESWVARRTRSR